MRFMGHRNVWVSYLYKLCVSRNIAPLISRFKAANWIREFITHSSFSLHVLLSVSIEREKTKTKTVRLDSEEQVCFSVQSLSSRCCCTWKRNGRCEERWRATCWAKKLSTERGSVQRCSAEHGSSFERVVVGTAVAFCAFDRRHVWGVLGTFSVQQEIRDANL